MSALFSLKYRGWRAERLRHGHQNFSRAGVRIAPMGGQHIVEHQDIAFLPNEADRLFSVRLAYRLNDGRLYRRAVAVIGIVWQVFFFQSSQQDFTRRWFERRDVKERGMIEPDHFAGQGMPRHGLTPLLRPQTISSPLSFNACLAAVILDCNLILGLKHGLPGE